MNLTTLGHSEIRSWCIFGTKCTIESVLQPFRPWHIDDPTDATLRDALLGLIWSIAMISSVTGTRGKTAWSASRRVHGCSPKTHAPMLLVVRGASTLHDLLHGLRKVLLPVSRKKHESVGRASIWRQFFVSATSSHAHALISVCTLENKCSRPAEVEHKLWRITMILCAKRNM